MINQLYLAGNVIAATAIYGHLQLVGRDENGVLREIEVQSGFFNWNIQGDGNRLHEDSDNTPYYDDTSGDDYRRTEIDLSGTPREPSNVWDIFKQASDAQAELALFRIGGAGDHYLFISDGAAGVTANDDVIQLSGVTSIGSINLTGGDLTILT